MALIIYNLIKK